MLFPQLQIKLFRSLLVVKLRPELTQSGFGFHVVPHTIQHDDMVPNDFY